MKIQIAFRYASVTAVYEKNVLASTYFGLKSMPVKFYCFYGVYL